LSGSGWPAGCSWLASWQAKAGWPTGSLWLVSESQQTKATKLEPTIYSKSLDVPLLMARNPNASEGVPEFARKQTRRKASNYNTVHKATCQNGAPEARATGIKKSKVGKGASDDLL
jgi:hypothetical protein